MDSKEVGRQHAPSSVGHRYSRALSYAESMPESDSTETYELKLKGSGVTIDKELDAETARQVMEIVMGGAPPGEPRSTGRRGKRRARAKTKNGGSGAKTKRRSRQSPGVVKTLSMRPQGKKSFKDFVGEKSPKTHSEKQIVIVDWLREEAGLTTGIGVDHVNTCYREARWSRPADLENNLQSTAAQKGWLDTSNMEDIKLTPRGEDQVEHELPPPSKK
jgi:hypothetical protein